MLAGRSQIVFCRCICCFYWRGGVPAPVTAGKDPLGCERGLALGTDELEIEVMLERFCCIWVVCCWACACASWAAAIFFLRMVKRLRAPSITVSGLANIKKCRKEVESELTLDNCRPLLAFQSSHASVCWHVLLRARLAHQWFVFTLKHGLEQHDTSHVA